MIPSINIAKIYMRKNSWSSIDWIMGFQFPSLKKHNREKIDCNGLLQDHKGVVLPGSNASSFFEAHKIFNLGKRNASSYVVLSLMLQKKNESIMKILLNCRPCPSSALGQLVCSCVIYFYFWQVIEQPLIL